MPPILRASASTLDLCLTEAEMRSGGTVRRLARASPASASWCSGCSRAVCRRPSRSGFPSRSWPPRSSSSSSAASASVDAGPVGRPASRRLPGADDADLGWVETVDEDGAPVLVPAAPRELAALAPPARPRSDHGASSLRVRLPRRSQRRMAVGAGGGARAGRAPVSDGGLRIAHRPVTVRCDDAYAFTGVGSDAAGVAFIPRALAYLEPSVCRRCTASRSSIVSVLATTRPSPSPCWRTKLPICGACATRQRRSALHFKRE